MGSPPQPPDGTPPLADPGAGVGLMTRVISWLIDFLIINLAAIITGLGAQLVTSIFPITKELQPLFAAIAGGAYVLWAAAYFVTFWSVTGQTPGARVMQVRLVTASGEKLRPSRALVRWLAMNVGMLPLPWGYVPIPFKRLGFPDWFAHTRVVEVQQLSIAAARMGPSGNGRPPHDLRPPGAAPAGALVPTDSTLR